MRFIKSEGKIARAELVNECSRLVSLEPSREDKEKIRKEEEELMLNLDSQLSKEVEASS